MLVLLRICSAISDIIEHGIFMVLDVVFLVLMVHLTHRAVVGEGRMSDLELVYIMPATLPSRNGAVRLAGWRGCLARGGWREGLKMAQHLVNTQKQHTSVWKACAVLYKTLASILQYLMSVWRRDIRLQLYFEFISPI